MTQRPAILATVDVVILTLHKGRLCVLTTYRDRAPFEGRPALPGGFIRADEDMDAEDAALRVLRSKVGVDGVHIEQLKTFSGPYRDPRGYSVSVAYLALVPASAVPEDAELMPVDTLMNWAFDHRKILDEAVARLRSKASYSSIPGALLESPFTLPELYAAYAQILGMSPDASSFRRKVLAVGAITPTGQTRPAGGYGRGRGGQTYTLADGEVRTFDITFKGQRS